MRSGFLVAAALLLWVSGPVGADTGEDKAGAEALFQEGRRLMLAKRFAEACPKFEASVRLDPAPGTELNLADCYEQLGRFASAWGMFRQAADEARRAADADAEKIALERAAALEPRLSRLTIQPPKEAVPGLVVSRNGLPVDAALLGTPVPVDAGQHKIDCRAPGRKGWTQELSVKAGDSMVAAVPNLAVDTATLPGNAGDSDLQIMVGERGERYEVELGTATGVLRCESVTHDQPCKLKAPAGPALLTVRGESTFSEDLKLKGKPVLISVEKTSRYLLYGGAVTAGVGAISLGAGLFACSQRNDRDIQDRTGTGVTCLAGSSFGGVAVIAGIVMVVMDVTADHHAINVHTEDDEEEETEEESGPPPPPAPRYGKRKSGLNRLYTTSVAGGAVLGLTGSF
jgi:hypothetical protein